MAKTKKKPNIWVNTDLEGVSGVWHFGQTRDRNSTLYREACEYMMGDIAALVRGLEDGGAGRIVVLDSHGGGNNFIPHLMEKGAVYVTGRNRGHGYGLSESINGAVLLGFHAMHGTPDGTLYHTQSSADERRYWYNGKETGEIGQVALKAGSLGIPVIMQIGDTASNRETRRFLGKDVVTVATKKGIHREAAELYPFARTREAIYRGAVKAVEALSRCKPYRIKLPIKAKCERIVITENPHQIRVETREATLENAMDVVGF